VFCWTPATLGSIVPSPWLARNCPEDDAGRERATKRHCLRDQATQNGLADSEPAVQREMPMSLKHQSSRPCNSWRDSALCHHFGNLVLDVAPVQAAPGLSCEVKLDLRHGTLLLGEYLLSLRFLMRLVR